MKHIPNPLVECWIESNRPGYIVHALYTCDKGRSREETFKVNTFKEAQIVFSNLTNTPKEKLDVD